MAMRGLLIALMAAVAVAAIAPDAAEAQQQQQQQQPNQQQRPRSGQQQPAQQPAKPAAKPKTQPAEAPQPLPPGKIDTAAKQAILIDARTGVVLLNKNADERMPPSSMSKVMTMYLVFEALKQGRMTLEDQLPVSERAWRMGGSKTYVMVGGRAKVEDLIRGVIVQSGNDACIVFAEALAGSEEAFADQLTRRAREIGLRDSNFRNATGWPDPQHWMTARDLAILAKRLIEDFPEYYSYYAEREFTYANIKQENRNPLLYRTPGSDGLKTGHTEAAGYGLTGSAVREGRRLILVVNGLNSMRERGTEADRLMEWGFREFENVALFKPGEPVHRGDVWLGVEKTLPFVPVQQVEITLPRRLRKDMNVRVVYPKAIPAPVRIGDPVGKVVVTVPSQPDLEFPLVAGADVAKLGFVSRLGATANYLLFGAVN
jgi:D-alanyl-D-alanine carboxypeptidase (penicillin-binding protein 5/6)